MESESLEKSLSSIIFLAQKQLISFIIIPNLLDQNFFLKFVQKTLYVFGHLDIKAEPVDRYKSFHQGNPKDWAVLPVWTL